MDEGTGPAENPGGDASEVRQKLINRFVAHNAGIFEAITDGIAAGEAGEARRLAHTLKSNAGQLGLQALQKAAETAEHQIKEDGLLLDGAANALKAELDAALLALTPLVRDRPAARGGPLEGPDALALLERAEAMLEAYDTACLELVGQLARIPGSQTLVGQIEDFGFDAAHASCQALRKALEISGKDRL